MLTEVSFRFPGVRASHSNEYSREELVSEEGSDFTWSPGPQALSILIVRSVAAALEGEKGFAITVPKVKSGTKRQSKSSGHPGNTLSNLLKNLSADNPTLFPWAWKMFGVDRDGRTPQLIKLITKTRSHVRMLWKILSPVTDIIIKCNGVVLKESAELRHLATEIELQYFPKSRKAKSNIPRKRTELLGRENACNQIQQLSISRPLVTLVGAGGCGKTDLCYEVARLSEHRYSEVRLIELAAISADTDQHHLEVEVGRGLSTNLAKGQQITVKSIANYIGTKKLLLVLDNCEHLRLPCKGLLDELLDNAALQNLRVLATSREAIGCRGEKVFDVDGLAYPPKGLKFKHMSDLQTYASVKLFLHKARNYSPRNDDAMELAEICSTLEGIPYAIELVAAQTNKQSLKGITKSLTDILSMGLPHAKHRHQQLIEASNEWSYDLLNEDEQHVLRKLSVFAGSWTREAAVSVCSSSQIEAKNIDSVLDRLIDKSLVETDVGRERYHLLVPTQQFVAGKLDAQEKLTTEMQHQVFFLEFAKNMDCRILTEEQFGVLNLLDQERNNIRASLERCLSRKDCITVAAELAIAMVGFWKIRGPLPEGQDYLKRCLERLSDKSDRILEAKLWHGLGVLAWAQNSLDIASDCLQKSQDIWRSVDNEDAEAAIVEVLHVRGMVAADNKEEECALSYFKEAMRRTEQNSMSSDRWTLKYVNLLISLGILHSEAKRFDTARIKLENSLSLAREIGDQSSISISLNNLAYIDREVASFEESRKHYSEALTIRFQTKNKLGIAWSLEGVARLAADTGKWDIAVRLFAAADQLREEISTTVPLSVRQEYDQAKSALRDQLGPARFEVEWETGSDLDYLEAAELALDFCKKE